MDKHSPSPVDVLRKTGHVRQATMRLTQANNIGDNGEAKIKCKAPIAGGSLSSSKRYVLDCTLLLLNLTIHPDTNYEYLTCFAFVA
jgi:hypothetical protein